MLLRDDLLIPIPGANPSGNSLRYDLVYDKIKEARREDDDAPQGDWQRERKTADFKTVIRLASEALATKSKDLQLAAWLTDALLRRDGFAGLREGIALVQGLLNEFWDTVHPAIQDGDLEMRLGPLEWVELSLTMPVRKVGITNSGLSYLQYKESRDVGYEEEAAASDTRKKAREEAVARGKITAEVFDKASNETPITLYGEWVQAIDGTLEGLDNLHELCIEKFKDLAPSYSQLRTALEEVRQVVNSIWQKKLAKEAPRPPVEETSAEEIVAEPEPEPEPSYQPVPTSSGGAAAAPARARKAVVGLEPADAEDAALRLAAVAKFLRQADGSNPAPYLLLRGFRWGELRSYGDQPDSSLLVPPSGETRLIIKRLFADGNSAELLEAAESAMAEPCGRAWLDLQRYVVRICEASGYSAIAAAIKSELKALLADIPALPHWTLADDTPTANIDTQAWLSEFVSPKHTAPEPVMEPAYSMTPASQDNTPAAAEQAPDTFQLAMAKVRSGRSDEAIELLAQEIQAEPSGRGRFQRKLQLAQLCLAVGHEAVAHPILQECAETIGRHRLEEWEPAEAVAHPLALLYRCLAKVDADPAERQKLYAQICRLDPTQAIACGR